MVVRSFFDDLELNVYLMSDFIFTACISSGMFVGRLEGSVKSIFESKHDFRVRRLIKWKTRRVGPASPTRRVTFY